MKAQVSSLISQGGTLAALVLGAFLATISGLIANVAEAHLRRLERERAAALLLGEVFSTLKVLLDGAEDARSRPPPYGPFTRRMLHAARRELDIYDRNRESLVDLRDAKLRADTHRLAIRLGMPLDGLRDSFSGEGGPPDDDARDRAFSFMMMTADQIPPLVKRLGVVARHSFDHFDAPAVPPPVRPEP